MTDCKKKKLAIVSTHPIQYNAPLFRTMVASSDMEIRVFYTWSQAMESVKDKEFGMEIKWDIPLLDGYPYEVVENISRKPKQQFGGLVNPELIPAIERWGADAVLVFGWNFKSHLKVMRYFHGKIPVYFRGDSTLLDDKPGVKTFMRRIALRWVYSHVDKAFYVGTNNRDYFLAHGLKPSQLIFAPHSVENSRFGTPEVEAAALKWREELGFSDSDIVITYAGKISRRKNILSFINEYLSFKKQHANTRLKLLIVGGGESESAIPNDPHIVRLPFQNQSKIPLIYSMSEVVVLPSAYGETWGLVINEAMASGKAVIVSKKVGCAIDLVKEGINGFYFDLNSSDNTARFSRLETTNLQEIGILNKTAIEQWNYQNISDAIAQTLTLS